MRSRYYQSISDVNQIRAGANYNVLKNSYIIFINTFDMFGLGLPIYTFENFCREDKTLPLNDGTVKVFINATSKQDNISPDLRRFLNYLLSGLPCSDLTGRIEAKIDIARFNQDWEVSYMTLEDKYKEMFEDGKEEGRAEGEAETKATLIGNLQRNGLSIAEIAKLIEMPENEVTEILQSAGTK